MMVFPIPIYVGRKYRATVGGSMWKHVKCLRCGYRFEYQVQCEASGTGESPYCSDNKGAAERAKQAAYRNLDRKLNKTIRAEPCPRCGIYQPDMVALLRKSRFGWLNVFGLLVLATAILFTKLSTPLAVIMIVTGIGLVLISLGGRQIYDPNRRAARRVSVQSAAQEDAGAEVRSQPASYDEIEREFKATFAELGMFRREEMIR